MKLLTLALLVYGPQLLVAGHQRCFMQCDSLDERGPVERQYQGQGPPGKQGPAGPKGETGDSGRSSSELNEEQLKNLTTELSDVRDRLASVEVLAAGSNWCAVGVAHNAVIADGQMTSSSDYRPTHAALHGRLHSTTGNGGWAVANGHNIVGEWIQVDMGATRRITGVATQGSYTTGQWVTSYTVQYKVRTSDDFVAVQDIGGGREAKVFPGNNDQNTVEKQLFPRAITARYVRLLPQSYHSWMFMRFELYQSC